MEEARLIDWSSGATHLLLNPRLPDEERQRLERLVAAAPRLTGHVWIATSGTSGALKLAALSKPALLASAAAVNRHLEAGPDDAWCCALPAFHVGGLGIYARAWLASSRVVALSWDAHRFARLCASESIALSSLVPAQVRDLVREQLAAPAGVRAVVVGGAMMEIDLYHQARALGWPVLPSYGMTECCSQVATAKGESPELILLPHLEARRERDGRLAFRGPSLLTGYMLEGDGGAPLFDDPKIDGWFVSEDLGEIDGRVLRLAGRGGEFVKIGGESVDLQRLDRILDQVLLETGGDAGVVAVPDERLGHVIHLAATANGAAIRDAFDARVLPFERCRGLHGLEAIPRTSLGKLRRASLLDAIRKG